MEQEVKSDRFSAQLHWSAVLGGSFFALACWAFFLALGAAIGSAAGKTGPGPWTVIHNLAAPVLALFLGGLVTARARDVTTKQGGALHGMVVWGFTMSIGFIAVGGGLLAQLGGNVSLPAGLSWAVVGTILASLITAVLGASTVPASRRYAVYEHGRAPDQVRA